MEINSVAMRDKKEGKEVEAGKDNIAATVTVNDAQSSFGGDAEMLTNTTLQTKIGNLALTFPNSQ